MHRKSGTGTTPSELCSRVDEARLFVKGPFNKKTRKATVNLTTQGRNDLAERVRDHEFLYNKKKTYYKNKDKTDRLWKDKAKDRDGERPGRYQYMVREYENQIWQAGEEVW